MSTRSTRSTPNWPTRRQTRSCDEIGGALDASDYDKAAHGVRQLMFLEKFGDEVPMLSTSKRACPTPPLTD